MSKWSSTSEELAREIARGLIVAEYGPEGTTATDYIGRDWEQ